MPTLEETLKIANEAIAAGQAIEEVCNMIIAHVDMGELDQSWANMAYRLKAQASYKEAEIFKRSFLQRMKKSTQQEALEQARENALATRRSRYRKNYFKKKAYNDVREKGGSMEEAMKAMNSAEAPKLKPFEKAPEHEVPNERSTSMLEDLGIKHNELESTEDLGFEVEDDLDAQEAYAKTYAENNPANTK